MLYGKDLPRGIYRLASLYISTLILMETMLYRVYLAQRSGDV